MPRERFNAETVGTSQTDQDTLITDLQGKVTVLEGTASTTLSPSFMAAFEEAVPYMESSEISDVFADVATRDAKVAPITATWVAPTFTISGGGLADNPIVIGSITPLLQTDPEVTYNVTVTTNGGPAAIARPSTVRQNTPVLILPPNGYEITTADFGDLINGVAYIGSLTTNLNVTVDVAVKRRNHIATPVTGSLPANDTSGDANFATVATSFDSLPLVDVSVKLAEGSTDIFYDSMADTTNTDGFEATFDLSSGEVSIANRRGGFLTNGSEYRVIAIYAN